MKRLVAALLFVVTVATSAGAAELKRVPPVDDYDDSQSHPLRIAAYLTYPIGFTLEWLIFRPFHRLVSQPGLEPVFGHREHGEDAVITTR